MALGDFKEPSQSELSKSHSYMMLNRLQADCEYFLGFGNGSEKRLWAGSVDSQIEEMRTLWDSFPNDAKPEWLSLEQISEYEQRMKSIRRDA